MKGIDSDGMSTHLEYFMLKDYGIMFILTCVVKWELFFLHTVLSNTNNF